MNKDFLNSVEFETKVRIKRPKQPKEVKADLEKEKAARRSKRFQKKLMRLVFFLFTSAALVWVLIYSCESTFSYLGGERVDLRDIISIWNTGDVAE